MYSNSPVMIFQMFNYHFTMISSITIPNYKKRKSAIPLLNLLYFGNFFIIETHRKIAESPWVSINFWIAEGAIRQSVNNFLLFSKAKLNHLRLFSHCISICRFISRASPKNFKRIFLNEEYVTEGKSFHCCS